MWTMMTVTKPEVRARKKRVLFEPLANSPQAAALPRKQDSCRYRGFIAPANGSNWPRPSIAAAHKTHPLTEKHGAKERIFARPLHPLYAGAAGGIRRRCWRRRPALIRAWAERANGSSR